MENQENLLHMTAEEVRDCTAKDVEKFETMFKMLDNDSYSVALRDRMLI